MLKICETKDSSSSSVSLPTSGMMQNGTLYQLTPLVCLTDAAAYGLLPTLAASDYKGTAKDRFYGSRKTFGTRIVERLRKSSEDGIYPSLPLCEAMMGYPSMWTELKR